MPLLHLRLQFVLHPQPQLPISQPQLPIPLQWLAQLGVLRLWQLLRLRLLSSRLGLWQPLRLQQLPSRLGLWQPLRLRLLSSRQPLRLRQLPSRQPLRLQQLPSRQPLQRPQLGQLRQLGQLPGQSWHSGQHLRYRFAALLPPRRDWPVLLLLVPVVLVLEFRCFVLLLPLLGWQVLRVLLVQPRPRHLGHHEQPGEFDRVRYPPCIWLHLVLTGLYTEQRTLS